MAVKAFVAVSAATAAFDKPFIYLVPDSISKKAVRGSRVLVPFGRANRKRVGLILDVMPADKNENISGLKYIFSVVDDTPVLNEEMMGLVLWLRENTFCTYFDAAKALLPSGMNIKLTESYELAEIPDVGELDESEIECLEFIKDSSDINEAVSSLKEQGKEKALRSLIEKGFTVNKSDSRQNVGDSTIKMTAVSDDYKACPDNYKLTVKQKALVKTVMESESELSAKEACYLSGAGISVFKKLVEKGVLTEYDTEIFRQVKVETDKSRNTADIILTDEQQTVYDRVSDVMDENKAHCFLLHGVTGSGKTSVFEKLIEKCLISKRQALVLIPEISLTPQTVRRFRELFGERVAVIHSGLSAGQRLDEHKRIKRGLADIVVGTRSAVFAPLDNIGLIVIDEEGERSYKSDSSPRYSAIDAAKKRCRDHKAVLLLASATPSIESYYYAQKGIYELLEMKKRFSGHSLPDVKIVDMELERRKGNTTEFSAVLADEIRNNLEAGEQTILLLNRRGYHTIISCCDCRKPVYCPNCSIPLTYHKTNDTLMCHYCGHTQPPVGTCPECGSERLIKMGFGTQKLEEQIAELFPGARVLRMDADTTMSRYSYEKNFRNFKNGRYDIMVGTQMIGKGLDFPNVTLVGMISLDKALYAGDFRSYERTFSLAAQVAGRCGRGEKKGRAYLQTFMPDHYVLTLAAKQDYPGFYREEIAIRRALLFPPVCDICILGVSSETDETAASFSAQLLGIIKSRASAGLSIPLRVLGPVRCSYGKINGKYRYRIILKCKNTAKLREFIRNVMSDAINIKEYKKVSLYADINGDIGV